MFALVLLAAVAADRSLSLAPFHAVDLATSATLRIVQAPVPSLVVMGDPRLARCVTAEVRDGRLVLGWGGPATPSSRQRGPINEIVVTARPDCRHAGNPERLTIRVAAPLVDGVTLIERGVVAVSALRTPTFAAAVPGRGSITIDGLRADRTNLAIGGIGHIAATGELGRLGIDLAGSGTIDTRAAHVRALEVRLGGQGSIAAAVDGPATGTLGGHGTIAIGGHPTCAIRREGSGRVVCPAG